jgi:hypothetical protein
MCSTKMIIDWLAGGKGKELKRAERHDGKWQASMIELKNRLTTYLKANKMQALIDRGELKEYSLRDTSAFAWSRSQTVLFCSLTPPETKSGRREARRGNNIRLSFVC